jgi:hypothetical protein
MHDRTAEMVVCTRTYHDGIPSNLGHVQHQLSNLSFCCPHHFNIVNCTTHLAKVIRDVLEQGEIVRDKDASSFTNGSGLVLWRTSVGTHNGRV